MPNEEEKNAAIAALQGKEFMWRVLSVSPVIPKVKSVESKPRSKPRSDFKPRREERTPRTEASSEAKSKYYSKFDGPPKPWQKGNKNSKPLGKKDEGSRPYYGKKDKKEGDSNFYGKPDRRSAPSSSKPPYKKFVKPDFAKRDEGSKFSTKPKPSKGFKMFHKVSGVSKTGPKRGRTDGS